MIQLNLLPDVKVEYIKSRSQKRFVMLMAVITISASLAVTAFLGLVVYGWQNVRMSNLKNSIAESTKKLKNTEGLNEILTIQNQLNALDGVHVEKPVMTRLFPYLSQTVPVDVKLQSITLDTAESSITLVGNASSLENVNKLVDTLKFTSILRDGETESDAMAFSKVVLTAFDTTAGRTEFTVTMNFDPTILSSTETAIQLSVPSTVSTRSTTEQPGALFQQSATGGTQ